MIRAFHGTTRGWGSWSGDVSIDEQFGVITVTPRGRSSAEIQARAVDCLRAVSDIGRIYAAP